MIQTLKIGDVNLKNNLILGSNGRCYGPAISSFVQRTGSGASLYGDGQCEGNLF